MIENAPWLPHEWCGFFPPDCPCRPMPATEWERSLRHSESAREEEARLAEHRSLAARWTAA